MHSASGHALNPQCKPLSALLPYHVLTTLVFCHIAHRSASPPPWSAVALSVVQQQQARCVFWTLTALIPVAELVTLWASEESDFQLSWPATQGLQEQLVCTSICQIEPVLWIAWRGLLSQRLSATTVWVMLCIPALRIIAAFAPAA